LEQAMTTIAIVLFMIPVVAFLLSFGRDAVKMAQATLVYGIGLFLVYGLIRILFRYGYDVELWNPLHPFG
jgi:hypothetical protein